MSEAELGAELFKIIIDERYHGITRFGMFDTKMLLRHIGFGDTPLYPSYFNGASGETEDCHQQLHCSEVASAN